MKYKQLDASTNSNIYPSLPEKEIWSFEENDNHLVNLEVLFELKKPEWIYGQYLEITFRVFGDTDKAARFLKAKIHFFPVNKHQTADQKQLKLLYEGRIKPFSVDIEVPARGDIALLNNLKIKSSHDFLRQLCRKIFQWSELNLASLGVKELNAYAVQGSMPSLALVDEAFVADAHFKNHEGEIRFYKLIKPSSKAEAALSQTSAPSSTPTLLRNSARTKALEQIP